MSKIGKINISVPEKVKVAINGNILSIDGPLGKKTMNIDTEIFARTMSGWEQIVGDEDPYLPYLTDEQRAKLKSRVEDLKNL